MELLAQNTRFINLKSGNACKFQCPLKGYDRFLKKFPSTINGDLVQLFNLYFLIDYIIFCICNQFRMHRRASVKNAERDGFIEVLSVLLCVCIRSLLFIKG